MFKYKDTIKYYYIFPKLFSDLSLRGKLCETSIYNIKGKKQLSDNEVDKIIKKIKELKNNAEGDVIVNYRWDKQIVNRYEINKIFEDYKIKI